MSTHDIGGYLRYLSTGQVGPLHTSTDDDEHNPTQQHRALNRQDIACITLPDALYTMAIDTPTTDHRDTTPGRPHTHSIHLRRTYTCTRPLYTSTGMGTQPYTYTQHNASIEYHTALATPLTIEACTHIIQSLGHQPPLTPTIIQALYALYTQCSAPARQRAIMMIHERIPLFVDHPYHHQDTEVRMPIKIQVFTLDTWYAYIQAHATEGRRIYTRPPIHNSHHDDMTHLTSIMQMLDTLA